MHDFIDKKINFDKTFKRDKGHSYTCLRVLNIQLHLYRGGGDYLKVGIYLDTKFKKSAPNQP